ncbi:hypothetical protein PtB15_14B506 [Puccinia triticina]|nr:hypothetical protein PtB15_14B506 [Puccinia triticina]
MVEEMVKRATRRLAKNALSQGDMPQGGTLLNEQQASDDAIRTEDNSLTPNSSSTRKVQGGPELVPDGSESDDSEAFKEVPGPVEETGNETGAIAAIYKALLSKVPQVPDPTDLIVVHDQQAPMAVKEPNSTSVPTVLVSNADKPKKSQKERLWEKVTEAVSNNDAENTEFFMGDVAASGVEESVSDKKGGIQTIKTIRSTIKTMVTVERIEIFPNMGTDTMVMMKNPVVITVVVLAKVPAAIIVAVLIVTEAVMAEISVLLGNRTRRITQSRTQKRKTLSRLVSV